MFSLIKDLFLNGDYLTVRIICPFFGAIDLRFRGAQVGS